MKTNKREWYNYILRDNGVVVYFGITKNPPDNEKEFYGVTGYKRVWGHLRNGKIFTSFTIDKCPRTREPAKELETERIRQYARSHNGKYPKYNKIFMTNKEKQSLEIVD